MTGEGRELESPHAGRISGASALCIASATGFAAALVFSAFPEIDIAFSRLFQMDDGSFAFAAPSLGAAVRYLLRVIFALVCAAAVIGFVSFAFFGRRLMGLGLAASAYIAICAAAGPGLVANLVFKDNWGRARPVQIEEFGGAKTFTPALIRSDQCERNCSFVSGEASNYFMIGFAFASLASGSRRRRLFQAAIVTGSFAGLIRIGAGGHFLSDVVFAGIFIAFTVRGLEWLILRNPASRTVLAEGGGFHEHCLLAGYRIAEKARSIWRRVT